MKKIDIFFFLLTMIAPLHNLKRGDIMSTSSPFPLESLPFFLIGGVIGLGGLS